jgi:hypothetical protein
VVTQTRPALSAKTLTTPLASKSINHEPFTTILFTFQHLLRSGWCNSSLSIFSFQDTPGFLLLQFLLVRHSAAAIPRSFSFTGSPFAATRPFSPNSPLLKLHVDHAKTHKLCRRSASRLGHSLWRKSLATPRSPAEPTSTFLPTTATHAHATHTAASRHSYKLVLQGAAE